MSGGVAYVWDADGDFRQNCNASIVTLGPLEKADEKQLKEMLEKHLAYTGSDKAKKLLGDFASAVKTFVRVMPNDYQKVLNAMAEDKKQKIATEDQPLFAFNMVASVHEPAAASAGE
jgi:glutamate synthase domain-containing protein 3